MAVSDILGTSFSSRPEVVEVNEVLKALKELMEHHMSGKCILGENACSAHLEAKRIVDRAFNRPKP
jgi:hypothetical protein